MTQVRTGVTIPASGCFISAISPAIEPGFVMSGTSRADDPDVTPDQRLHQALVEKLSASPDPVVAHWAEATVALHRPDSAGNCIHCQDRCRGPMYPRWRRCDFTRQAIEEAGALP